jgi:hypothetical protein
MGLDTAYLSYRFFYLQSLKQRRVALRLSV